MVAAALIVSAPMVTTSTTDSFAAAKAKAKSSAPQNDGFWMALGDNLSGKSVEAKKATPKKAKAKKSKGKKAAKSSGGMGGKKK
jgi:hypothetical protein